MNELIKADDVAYIRFASIYKDFSNVETFLEELKKIKEN
jgi:transcriptional repressor NrdR